MAKILNEGNEIEVPDGEKIMEKAEEIGVPFGCQNGQCQTCIIEVEEGMDNLSEKTQEEIDADLGPNQRLACQCKIKSGVMKFKFD